ncbi:MAG TPA: Clp protease N-terminal domain-containing protein [Bryobacteraceae bacterium]|jgi:ATP-dependent Clp protease ATP-binding subunit ClpC
MFERYVEKARRAIFFARYEASQSGSQWIETHHLLLGLLRENWEAFEPFLKSRDRAMAIRKEIEQRFPQQPKISVSVDLPLSHQSKRALAHAAEEAEHLAHPMIEPVHLVLGLLCEPDAVAAILAPYGMSLEALRAAAASSPAGTGIRRQREPWQAALIALPADRQDAARRILEALRKDKVRIEVTSPEDSFTVSFDTIAPA